MHNISFIPEKVAKPWLQRLLWPDKCAFTGSDEVEASVNQSPLNKSLTLALSLSTDNALQQVLTDGEGHLWVGETSSFVASEIQPQSIAPRIFERLLKHRGAINILCSPEMENLPWANHLCMLNPALSKGEVQLKSWGDNQKYPSNGRQVFDPFLDRTSSAVPVRVTRVNRHVFSLSYDLVESTRLMTSMGAEAYSMMLSRFHAKFASIAARWQGQIDAPQGDDGCMCYFGAILADEHAGLSCLQAALEMRESARAQGWQVRIGIAAGWLAVEGSQPVGLTVHLAARLQKIAESGSISVSRQLAQHFASVFEFEMKANQDGLKGFDGDIQVAVLRNFNHQLKTLPPSAPFESSIVFAGRERQITELDQAWSNTVLGSGTDVSITGAPGIGKSTLIRRWLEVSHLNASVLTCGPHDYRQPFASIGQWLIHEIGFTPSGDRAEQRGQLLALLSVHRGLAQYRYEIADLLDLYSQDQSGDYEDALARHERVLHAMSQLMIERSRVSAQLFIVEDYQWIDASTAQWIEQIKQLTQQGHRIMLIVTQRPALKSQANYIAHRLSQQLEPLNAQQSQHVIAALAPDIFSDQALVNQIQSSSQGIPLYLKESTRLLRSDEYRSKLRTARRLGIGLPVPRSLNDVLMERLDHLGSDRQIAQIGSVLGQSFTSDLLKMSCQIAHPADTSEEMIAKACQKMVAEELWIRKYFGRQIVYEFSHALIRDVAYQSMWETDRKAIHRAAAQVLRDQSSSDLDINQTQLARHLAASGDIRAAVEHLLAAGKRSKKRGAHLVATQTMQTVLELLEIDHPQDETANIRIEANLALAGQMLITEGYESNAVLDYYSEALNLSQILQNDKLILRAQLGIQSFQFMRGNFIEARHLIEQSKQTATRVQHVFSDLQCDWALANLLFYEGRLVESSQLMAQCIALCSKHSMGKELIQNPHVMASMYRAFSLSCIGQFIDALELTRKGCDLADSGTHKLARLQAHGIAAMVYYSCGLWQQALQASETAVASCQPSEYGLWFSHAKVMQGAAKAKLGDAENGIALMREHHQQWAKHGGTLTRSYYWVLEAELLLEAQDTHGAKAAIELASEHLEKIPERYYASEVVRLAASIDLKLARNIDTAKSTLSRLFVAYDQVKSHQIYGLSLRIALEIFDQVQLFADTNQHDEALIRVQESLMKVQQATGIQDVLRAKALLTDKAGGQVHYLQNYKKA